MSDSKKDQASLKRELDNTDNQAVKKPKDVKQSGDSNLDLVVPVEEGVSEFEQLRYYLASALENIGEDENRALEFLKVTINEANNLLQEKHQTEPENFDSTFYLTYGLALFYYAHHSNDDEENEGFALAQERLTTSKDLLKKDDKVSLEVLLSLAKVLYQKANDNIAKAEQFDPLDDSEDDEVGSEKELKDKVDTDQREQLLIEEADLIKQVISLMDDVLDNHFKDVNKLEGLFGDLSHEVKIFINVLQNHSNEYHDWSQRKALNSWVVASLDKVIAVEDNSYLIYLVKANSLISLTNHFFDVGSYEEGSEESDSEIEIPKNEMNRDIAKESLLEAITLSNDGISSYEAAKDDDIESLAQLYSNLGEAHLNLGNLETDDSKENEHFKKAVDFFRKIKTLGSLDLLPDRFQDFLDDWESKFTED